ncbi:MAG: hypothetical protein NC398_07200 [Acetatifactor muris]|nr:hypothetical protein [Acetatifactor muris]MCM1525724.1 hypothetical protein [Bacteroides sp.]
MADSKGTRKSVKNLYDGNTGFPIIINLYVIKYLYYHIKKADCFMDEDYGRKAKAYPIYGTRGFPVSRQRFDRIKKGHTFEFTRGEADSVTETYGIDNIYFRKTEPVPFEIKGISDAEWKCFYNIKYEGHYGLPDDIKKLETVRQPEAIKKKSKKVEDALKGLAEGWEKLEHDNPVYAVCYYFHYGERFDKPDIIKNLKDILSVIAYREWDKEDIGSLKEILSLMKGHYQYVSSLVTLNTLQEKQKIKK